MRHVKSCGFLIVRGSPVKDFLLMRHPHRWDLPKGHVDPGEDELQCAVRELEEETGIDIDAIEIDAEFRFTAQYPVIGKKDGQRRQKTLVIFLARLIRDVQIRVSEHPGYQWFDWRPPHQIQVETIDAVLLELERYLQQASQT